MNRRVICDHDNDESYVNIYKYAMNFYLHTGLIKLGVIPDLANIVLNYLHEIQICETCLKLIISISPHKTIIIYNLNKFKYYLSAKYKVIFLLPAVKYTATPYVARIVSNFRPQIIHNSPIITYRVPKKSRFKKLNNPKIRESKKRSAKLFKKQRNAGYKFIENIFNTYEYDTYFDTDYQYCENLGEYYYND
jgi:hypothetical protein